MILEFLKKIFSWIIDTVLGVFDFPVVPAALSDAVNYVLSAMGSGLGIINVFCPIDRIRPAIDLFLAVWLIARSYKILMWVLRKIPVLGID